MTDKKEHSFGLRLKEGKSVRALVAATAPLALPISGAQALDTDVLIQQELHARTHCLVAGHSNIPKDQVWCEMQESFRQSLFRKGSCFGKEGQPQAEYRWHRCEDTSVVTP